jgi:tRNA A-37 threonylcarbamoyl transferase component Bud32
MDQSEEQAFIDELLERALVAPDQLEECRKLVGHTRSLGVGGANLRDTLVSKGLLDAEQAEEVWRHSLGGGGPQVIAGYELMKKIGQGGMGIVYLARHVNSDRIVALKILATRLVRDKQYVERFIREARAAGQLNHIHIIRGLDVGRSEQGHYYFAMEYVEGETVRDILKRQGRIAPDIALRIVIQMAKALDHAWQAGIIHRDVKPDNIMIARDGTAKLADLGLARSSLDEAEAVAAGKALGTPDYVSPEQARGKQDLDTRSDIYSLGATLFHMVTGTVPYAGETPAEIVGKHVNAPVPSARAANAQVPEALSAAIAKMMAKDPAERYQMPAELLEDLELIAAGKPPEHVQLQAGARAARPPAAPRKAAARRSARAESTGSYLSLAIAGGVVLLVLAGLALFWPASPGKATKTDSGQEETPVDKHLQAAQAAFDQATSWDQAQPNEYKRNIDAFLKIDRIYFDTEFGPRARMQADRIKQRLDAAAKTELDARTRRADDLIAALKLGDAVKVFGDFPPNLIVGNWAAKLDSAGRQARDKAVSKFNSEMAEARNLQEAGKEADALSKYGALAACGLQPQNSEAAAAIERIKQASTAQRAEALAKAWDAIQQATPAWRKARQYAEAIEALDKLLADNPPDDLAIQAKALREEFDLLAGFLKDAEAGALALKGRDVLLKNAAYRIEDVREGKIIAKAGDAAAQIDIDTLPASELTMLVKALRKADKDVQLRLGVFLLADTAEDKTRNLATIRRELEAAQKLGANAEPYLARLGLDEGTESDKAATTLWTAAQTEKDPKTRRDLLEKLLDKYGQTPTTTQHRNEITRLLESVKEAVVEPEILSSLLKGKLTMGKAGSFRAEYTFAENDQLADWEFVKGVQIVDGELLIPAGTAFTTKTVFLPKSVECNIGLVAGDETQGATLHVVLIPVDTRGGDIKPLDPCWNMDIVYGTGRDQVSHLACTTHGLEWKRTATVKLRQRYPLRMDFGSQGIDISFNRRFITTAPCRISARGGYRIRFSGASDGHTWGIDNLAISGVVDEDWLAAAARQAKFAPEKPAPK